MTSEFDLDPSPSELVEFAHESELQFARLLDFYTIDWEYEPTEFAVEWDENGTPCRFFRPDFFLPKDDMYIEITTMNQKLVTKKNRKVRQLHTLYPTIKCKVFYQRDYLHLLVKYGLEEPSDQNLPEAPSRVPGPPRILDLGVDALDDLSGLAAG